MSIANYDAWIDTDGYMCDRSGVRVPTALTPAQVSATQALVSGAGNRVPYAGPVATRCQPASALSASYQQLQGRSKHFATESITSLQLVYANWYLTNPASGGISEINASDTTTIRASIEYPIGTFTQVTFSGSAAGTMAPGATLTSDACAISIPIGAAFWVVVFQTNPTAIIFTGQASTADFGEKCNIADSGLTDPTLTGTITNAWPTITFHPYAIIGKTSRRTVALFGDSRCVGVLDTPSDGYIGFGEIERTMSKKYATLNLANGGERMSHVAGGNAAKRIALASLAGCSTYVSQYGINDFVNSRTATQFITDTATFRGLIGASKTLVQATVAPVTTSTDSWATTANQTVTASNTERVAANLVIRRCMDGAIDGYIEIADVVESARNSGIWKANYTGDGTHENQLSCEAIQASRNVADPMLIFD